MTFYDDRVSLCHVQCIMQPHRINIPAIAKREVIHLLGNKNHMKLM